MNGHADESLTNSTGLELLAEIEAGLLQAEAAARLLVPTGSRPQLREASELLGAGLFVLQAMKDVVDRKSPDRQLRLISTPTPPLAEDDAARPPAPALRLTPVEAAPEIAAAPPRSWEELLAAFSTHLLAAGRSTGTIRLRMTYLRQFAQVQPDPLAVGREDLELFLAVRRGTHKAETRSSIRTALQLFYAWLLDTGAIAKDPAVRLASVRRPATVARIAPDVDLERALQTADARERAMILLARFGCLRREEIATLKIENRHDGTLHVLGKGEKERRVPINPQLLEALVTLEGDRRAGYYFPGRGDGHAHVDTVHTVISELTGWNPHSLRHAGATAAYRATKNLRAVQELLGHSSIATTERYLHVDENDLRSVADATSTGFDS